MILALALSFLFTARVAQTASVLDPALFLAPSPPLPPSGDQVSVEDRWSGYTEPRIERDVGDLSVVPLEKEPEPELTQPTESMEGAETFWPSLRLRDYGIRSIHVPLTFSVTGNYGNYGGPGTGVIASSYGNADVIGAGFSGLYGKSGLAGSGYSAYSLPAYQGTRVYGSGGAALWSGWGNGKWGHYGKG